MLIGFILSMTTVVYGADIKEYILKKASYPILVDGAEYNDPDLPVLNYQGNTYVPLKAIGVLLEKPVYWNEELGRVEIGQTPLSTNNEDYQPEVIKSYIDGKDALKINNNIFVPVYQGFEKYQLNEFLELEYQEMQYVFKHIDFKIKIERFNNMNELINAEAAFILNYHPSSGSYSGTSFVNEKLIIEARNLMDKKITEEQKRFENIDYEKFKELFTMGEKTLNSSNMITADAKYDGLLDTQTFLEIWNWSDTERNEYLKRLFLEEKSKNPNHDLIIGFYFKRVHLGSVYDLHSNTIVNLVKNPFPIQDSIVQ